MKEYYVYDGDDLIFSGKRKATMERFGLPSRIPMSTYVGGYLIEGRYKVTDKKIIKEPVKEPAKENEFDSILDRLKRAKILYGRANTISTHNPSIYLEKLTDSGMNCQIRKTHGFKKNDWYYVIEEI